MTPYEIMLSESQEADAAVAQKGREEKSSVCLTSGGWTRSRLGELLAKRRCECWSMDRLSRRFRMRL